MGNVIAGTKVLALSGPATIGVVSLVAGSANATCKITDASAGSGAVIIAQLAALAGTTGIINLSKLSASTGVWLDTITGTGAVVLVELV